jgi:hypothetical protein
MIRATIHQMSMDYGLEKRRHPDLSETEICLKVIERRYRFIALTPQQKVKLDVMLIHYPTLDFSIACYLSLQVEIMGSEGFPFTPEEADEIIREKLLERGHQCSLT